MEPKNQLDKHIKAFWSNQGGEYLSSQFNFFLKKHRIICPISLILTNYHILKNIILRS